MLHAASAVVLALFFAAAAVGAGPAASPLDIRPDAIGVDLQRRMIWTPPDAKPSSKFVAFRKSFDVAAMPSTATLRLFADARYMLWINGRYVLRGPARFDTKGPEYDTIDVAPFLRAGSNSAVVLVLGNVSNGAMQRHAPGLTLRIDAPAGAANEPLLSTDATWTWSDRTRYRNPRVDWGNIVDRVDARLDDGDWTRPDYDDSKWTPAAVIDGGRWGPLTARRTPLLRETPVTPTFDKPFPAELKAGEKLAFKLDRLVQAYTVLKIDADAGSELVLDYAGVQYVARGGEQTYLTSDTHGVPAGGAIVVKSGRVTVRSVELVERLYPFDVAGRFDCNDDLLNKLWAVCVRSGQVFSEDAYVDCADRERVEWMDCDPPAFDVTRVALAGPGPDGKPLYADARLLGALLRRTALSVQPEGWVKAHTCSDRFDIHAKMEDRGCDWVQGARRYYDSTHDDRVVREIWPVILRQMDWFLAQRTERGLVRAREWVTWGNPVCYQTLEGTGLNAFVFKALVDAAYLGRAIGDEANARRYDGAATELAAAVNRELWDDTAGTYFAGYFQPGQAPVTNQFVKRFDLKVDNGRVEPTTHAALFALDQGLVPAERRERVLAFLLASRAERPRIMGIYYLFKQLYARDTQALDRQVLERLRTEWKPIVDWPWQTSWEYLNGEGSKAHIYGMYPAYFLSAYVLGVRRDAPAVQRQLVIEPRLGDLTSAEGTVVTEFGPVPVKWDRAGRTLTFAVTVPENVQAVLRLPDATSLTIDGTPVVFQTEGRTITTPLAPGVHSGTADIRSSP